MSLTEIIKELRAALGTGARLIATDGFSDFDLLLKLAGAASEGMTVGAPGVPNEQLPATGKQFVAAFGRAAGEVPGPYPAYAAQAHEVLLDAIGRSNGTRASVTKELLATRVKNGILGTFSIDRNGDTTAGAITIYRITRGSRPSSGESHRRAGLSSPETRLKDAANGPIGDVQGRLVPSARRLAVMHEEGVVRLREEVDSIRDVRRQKHLAPTAIVRPQIPR